MGSAAGWAAGSAASSQAGSVAISEAYLAFLAGGPD